MKSVGVREFRDRATSMVGSGETLVIERHGEPIGFFVPITVEGSEGRSHSARTARELVEEVLEQSRIDEDDLVREVSGSRRKS